MAPCRRRSGLLLWKVKGKDRRRHPAREPITGGRGQEGFLKPESQNPSTTQVLGIPVIYDGEC